MRHVLRLQQAVGNRAVTRSVQRQVPTTSPTVHPDPQVEEAGPNPLVGLRKGDGLDVGTFDRRPRVKLLQHRLNGRTGAALAVDGMWGAKTSAALEEFQLDRNMVPADVVDEPTGDALMGIDPGPAEPPGTTPPQTVPPGTEPPGTAPPGQTPFNPHVESRLEAVLEEYRFVFSLQKEALHRLESDLAEIEDAEPGLFEELMAAAVNAVMDQFIGVTFDGITEAVASLHGELTPEQLASTTDKASEKVATAAKGRMAEDLADTSPGIDDVAAFIETQLHGAADAAAETHSDFLIRTKPAMSKLHPGEVATTDDTDPRVARAEKLRQKVREGRGRAFDVAYDRALSRWSVYLAQKAVHVPGEGATTTGPDGQEGTNLADEDETAGAAGVLQLTFKAGAPDQDVVLESVRIIGLSEKVRNRLNKSDRSLGQLGFPTRAEGDLTEGEILSIDFDPADVTMSRNEVGRDFLNDDGGEDGRAWLAAKAQHEEGLLPDIPAATPERGASLVLNDLLRRRTSQHPVDKG